MGVYICARESENAYRFEGKSLWERLLEEPKKRKVREIGFNRSGKGFGVGDVEPSDSTARYLFSGRNG
jgi:hypothetical protein